MFLSSLCFALLAKLKIWQTTETYPPQTFSVTAAVVAPAVAIYIRFEIRRNFSLSIFLGIQTTIKF